VDDPNANRKGWLRRMMMVVGYNYGSWLVDALIPLGITIGAAATNRFCKS